MSYHPAHNGSLITYMEQEVKSELNSNVSQIFSIDL